MVKKRLLSHTVNKNNNKDDIDRNKIKMLSTKWLTEMNILYKVDIIKCIINWLVNEIYSKGIIMEIFKNDNNSKSEIIIEDNNNNFNIKKDKESNIDNIFSDFDIFRKNELEIDKKWTLLYKNIIINFILYGFVVIKFKNKNNDSKKIPEILNPLYDCSVGFNDNINEITDFVVFCQSNSNSIKTDKMTCEFVEDVRVIEYSSLNKNLRLFESNINQIKNTIYLYTTFLINNAKYNYFATNPPRVYSPEDDDKIKVNGIQTITEDLEYNNVIQGGRIYSNLKKKKEENNKKQMEDLQNRLIEQNIILNTNNGNKFIKKKIKNCRDTKKLKEINLLELDGSLPISYDTISPKDLKIDPNNEIKIKSQHEYIKTLNNFIELICLGLNLRADIIFPTITPRSYSSGQEFITSGINRTISNWQEEISNTIFIIYADIILPYLYQLLEKILKEKKKNEIIKSSKKNNNIIINQKIEDMLSSLIVSINFKPNQKLSLNSLLLFEKMYESNIISKEFYLKLALNIYSLGEPEEQTKNKKNKKNNNNNNDDSDSDNDNDSDDDNDDNNNNNNNKDNNDKNKNKRKNGNKIKNNKTKKQKINNNNNDNNDDNNNDNDKNKNKRKNGNKIKNNKAKKQKINKKKNNNNKNDS